MTSLVDLSDISPFYYIVLLNHFWENPLLKYLLHTVEKIEIFLMTRYYTLNIYHSTTFKSFETILGFSKIHTAVCHCHTLLCTLKSFYCFIDYILFFPNFSFANRPHFLTLSRNFENADTIVCTYL